VSSTLTILGLDRVCWATSISVEYNRGCYDNRNGGSAACNADAGCDDKLDEHQFYGDGAAGLPVSGTTNLNNSGKFEFVTATGPVSAVRFHPR